MTLHFRTFVDHDLDACLRLWAEHTEWGPITAAQWRTWFRETPDGEAIVSIAVDEAGEVVGQEVFTPTRVRVAARTLRGLRLSAPILRSDLRMEQLRDQNHPVIGLFHAGLRAARERGFDLIYSLPARGWLPFFRWSASIGLERFEWAEFGCLKLALDQPPTREPVAAEDVTAQRTTGLGAEFTQLWEESCRNLPIECGAVRDLAALQYRIGGAVNIDVRHAGRLIGYVSVKPQTGLIADLLADRSESLPTVLAAAVRQLALCREQWALPAHITSIDTPILGKSLRDQGFEEAAFRFAFVCYPLSESVSRAEIQPARWYLTGGD